MTARRSRFAGEMLSHRARKLIKKLDRLEKIDDRTSAIGLRIAAKKLYYATGFFESLFTGHNSGKRVTKFKKHIEEAARRARRAQRHRGAPAITDGLRKLPPAANG